MASKRRTMRSARQLFRFCLVHGALDEGRVRTVVQRAIASKRRGVTAMLTEFQRLVRLDRERHTATVESAAPLSESIRAEVVAGVARTHGQGIETSFVDNPALIGGMRIQVGSDVYDGSVRAKLDAIASGL
ncbi:MAG TPA: F0F1 ATP synthase subunit delta [Vicinamibacterales bacterium]|nr:F0F1 ATP synthase subunit delta [Vicinamibacterales bacterium]